MSEDQPTAEQIENHRIAYEMGRVVLVWSHVEATSHTVLWMAADVGNVGVGRIMTSGLQTGVVWDQIPLLLGLRDGSEPYVEWFVKWRVEAARLQGQRNTAVHGWWLATGDPSEPYKALDVFSRKARRGPRSDVFPGGGQALGKLADSMHVASEELRIWMQGPLTTFVESNPLRVGPPESAPE